MTIGSPVYEQLATAKAWGYKLGRTEYWEDLPIDMKELLIAFDRVQDKIQAVISHDAAKQQRAAAKHAELNAELNNN